MKSQGSPGKQILVTNMTNINHSFHSYKYHFNSIKTVAVFTAAL